MAIINNNPLSKADIKTLFGFLLFLLIYLLPGIFGHNPWKQDENYSFGIIQTMYETDNWLIPTNAGQPFMEKPRSIIGLQPWVSIFFRLVTDA